MQALEQVKAQTVENRLGIRATMIGYQLNLNSLLGKSQAQLFRKGGLSAEQFRKLTSSKFGQPLTLQEIKAKDADAWRDANLD